MHLYFHPSAPSLWLPDGGERCFRRRTTSDTSEHQELLPQGPSDEDEAITSAPPPT
jgi:hypothetical protein